MNEKREAEWGAMTQEKQDELISVLETVLADICYGSWIPDDEDVYEREAQAE